jgi:hypothetical protein
MNEPNDQTTKLETAQSDLKQLMADVTRAMEKAQQAVARITSTVAAATTGTESTNTSPLDQLANDSSASRNA